MLRTTHWIGLLMLAGLATGCAHMTDVVDEKMMELKCCHEAKMAWLRCSDLYSEVCYPFDFGGGFRAGYREVCMGGDGCVPPMPPRNYWSHHYQCDEGKIQIMAWYDGYHHGVLAAQCNGCEGRSQVVCAQDLYGNKSCEADYSEIEHHVVPEDEMPGYPFDMPYDMPLGTPPPPAIPGQGVPMAPEAYDVGTEAGPTLVPELRRILSPGIDATSAPTF